MSDSVKSSIALHREGIRQDAKLDATEQARTEREGDYIDVCRPRAIQVILPRAHTYRLGRPVLEKNTSMSLAPSGFMASSGSLFKSCARRQPFFPLSSSLNLS